MATAKEVIKEIRNATTVESIKALIKDEDRGSVLKIANSKIAKLSEGSDDYFDDAQKSDNSPEVHPVGSSLGHVHDKK
jgi:hypothetical protein